MKKSLLSWSLTVAAMFAFSISVFAQHGASGMGAGRPAGVGPGSTGAPSGVGPGTSGRPTDVGSTGSKITFPHAGFCKGSTRYPRFRSVRIIRSVRTRLDFSHTAGPRSS